MSKYTPVIGLEVHVELKTKSKMFCGCSADYFGKEPNTHTCPVCLGLPGALPVPNKKAIDWCIMIGLALNCEIPLLSKFDRKNYFYPDLAKGYQISQYDKPFAIKGKIKLDSGKIIGITRAHMEEDTAKLTHRDGASLIDFNRSGVPLVEIVTEPDFDNAEDVKDYLKKLQQIVRYLDVSDANMERGDMRLEPNISLRPQGQTGLPNYKVEVKNINSFNFVAKAIEFEIKRQSEILDKDERPTQETRGFVESSSSTVSQRGKEEAADYRYFPEPDIPPLRWTQSYVEGLKEKMPQLASQKYENYVKEYGISEADAKRLTSSQETAALFELVVKEGVDAKSAANAIVNKKVDVKGDAIEIAAKINELNTKSDISNDKLNETITIVLSSNEQAVSDYKSGKETAIMFLVGQVMRSIPERVDAEKVKASLLAKIK
jgi:aspartyl-tRNA(Asn)/glutamyl-tRNA(Gln) amidotransferase subunit B